MLKTMLSTGSKVANSSLVGAAPAIKYHWPRWGSGNWRDKEGSRRRWVSLQNPTSSSVRMTVLRDEGVGCLFPAKDWIRDKESLNDFSSLLLFSKHHSPVLHVSTLMAIVLIYIFNLLLSSSQHSHPFFLPVWLSGHAGPLTLVHQSPLSPNSAASMLSAYLFPLHSFSCQLAVLRALVDGVKEKAIEVEKSCPNVVEHLQAGGSWCSVWSGWCLNCSPQLAAQYSLLPAPLPRPLTLSPANE